MIQELETFKEMKMEFYKVDSTWGKHQIKQMQNLNQWSQKHMY